MAKQELKPKARKLVVELQDGLNLGEVDARRAAFVALALSHSWSKARIGRYLGVSRARVGQRVAKYERYAQSGEYPALRQALGNGGGKPEDPAAPVSFDMADWQDLTFADGLLNRLS